ncbi:hypothetical protein V2S66_33105 [Streptomyces sp. V4-01]|uniref:Uncharacterized protein n=1 Tax=Actinacidiphila polyblastidii TaxID=3110430 RepID=A0ABU7PM65_9ACTN|nr:hypothetical protein [Streptomyces sp. V4-01]
MTLLPIALVLGAIEMEPDAGLFGIQDVPSCMIQDLHVGAHHGLVASEKGDDAVWAVWSDEGTAHLQRLLDCTTSSADDTEGCGLYDQHEGRHTFELYDPQRAAAEAIVAMMPLTQKKPAD